MGIIGTLFIGLIVGLIARFLKPGGEGWTRNFSSLRRGPARSPGAATYVAAERRFAARNPCFGAKINAARKTPVCSSTMQAPVDASKKKLT